MKKRFSKLDAIAATLLVGTAGAMAIGQVVYPQPVFTTCPGGTYAFPPPGPVITYPPITCMWPYQCGFSATSVPAIGFYYAANFCAVPA